MADIAAVILIPAKGDPHGLLRIGPCGAMPPMASKVWQRDVWAADPDPPWEAGQPPRGWGQRALVLAWEGEPVAEGIARCLHGLALREGCPFDPHLVVFADDVYRRERAWRLIAFVNRARAVVKPAERWGPPVYKGKPWRLADCIHIPDLDDITREHSLAPQIALATIATARDLGTVLLLDADSLEVTGD